jgi:hypothetical protein
VGAQKAGTTWLYNYIQNDPKANLGLLKEYHFWNFVMIEKNGGGNKKMKNFLDRDHKKLDSGELLRWTMMKMKNYYQVYFNSIINDGYEITGDITPQYARCSSEGLSHIKASLEKYNFTVKIIFLIRDPVERIWSNIRMEKNDLLTIDSSLSDTDLMRIKFKDRNKWDSLYDFTIKQIYEVFDKKNIYIGVYEEMFIEDQVKKLSNFIGVDYNPTMITKKINSSDKIEKLDADVINEVRDFYNKTYEFCFQNFPQTKELWNK